MTMPTYNLLDERWMPVRMAGGEIARMGLLELFARSRDIVSLAHTAPPTLVAHHRLLITIVRRAMCRMFPAGWTIEHEAEWYQQGIPFDVVQDYLEHWRHRFWLFHNEAPFMQVAALSTAEETRNKAKPWTQVSLASASGNVPLVFDHSDDLDPPEVAPDVVLNHLLGFLQFTPGGLVKVIRGSDRAGPLANTAAVIPLGENLSQTLMLCLPSFVPQQADDDIPAWERAPLTVSDLAADASVAAGPNDRYTRQTRAVLLLREESGGVRWIRFAAGLALEEDESAPDPMAAFRQGTNGLVRLAFSGGRALWRELPALLPNPQGKGRAAASLMHALSLHEELAGIAPVYQPVLVAGLTSNQAKLERWRAEQMSVPMALIGNPDKVQALIMRLERAETLFFDLRSLVALMVATTLPHPEDKETRSRARAIVDASPFSATYFSHAAMGMAELLEQISQAHMAEADQGWNETLRRAAEAARRTVVAGTGNSGKALLAVEAFQPRFWGLLNKQLPVPQHQPRAQYE